MKCEFTKKNKEQCGANAMIGSKYCFLHNPKTKKMKTDAIATGGKALKRNHSSLPPVALETPRDVVNLLAITINEARGGLIQLKIANCIGYLSGQLIKAFETADLEERLAKLEKTISKNE